ncbi:MAG TPA: SPOR domain-containing protein [Candidatus Acidoferrales bacterium]|jgi:cell division septation protein DedD|nr:SPOR domain-containing protein [Candidatus Acidoferrales bacterium]
MARRGSRGDRVLESRHLIGLFVGVVILCAVFFTLGYVMGRSHYASSVQAFGPDRGVVSAVDRQEMPRERAQPKEDTPAPAGEWDFYANQSNNKLEKPAPAPPPPEPEKSIVASNRNSEAPAFTPAASAPRPSTRPVRMTVPKMAGNSVLLQVAAVTHQSDALAMADALQRKRFPSFVVAPSGDPYYRVQVGPYPDERAAENARAALDRAGFKAIIKH